LRELLGEKKTWPLVALKQIHSDRIHFVAAHPKEQPQGDGVITNVPGLVLSIQTADCLPVLLADPEHRAIGAFHAGWRGTLARIVEKGVGEMRRRYGTDPKKLIAVIGPGIHACCYVVGEELREQFQSQFPYGAQLFYEVSDADPVRRKYPLLFMNARAPGHGDLGPELHLDLVKANVRQLGEGGVQQENIEVVDLCTSCRKELLFSHRAERGKTGRMLAVIAIKRERRPRQKPRRRG
jgi:YfiH family protein